MSSRYIMIVFFFVGSNYCFWVVRGFFNMFLDWIIYICVFIVVFIGYGNSLMLRC